MRRRRHEQGFCQRPARRLLRRRGGGRVELLLLHLGRGGRGPADADAPRGHPRVGPEPDQGIEFDYCCVHAAQTFRALGFEAIMVNCNPETVSTDYDTSDRLYFEPLSPEEVLAVCDREQPVGVVTQFGGQTPLKLARAIEEGGYRILGTPHEAIDLAEDRARFGSLVEELGVRCPPWAIAATPEEAIAAVREIGYPSRPPVLRPRRARDAGLLRRRRARDGDGCRARGGPPRPVRRARDRLADDSATGEEVYIAAVMQHVEEAGIHSGDSACVLPAPSLTLGAALEVEHVVKRLGPALGVVGLLNVQLAIADGTVYVLEVNPRASRTVPFASKAIGVNLVEIACRLARARSSPTPCSRCRARRR